jgi:predicted ATPase/DNA-binding SARP family transcriptional activator
MKLVTPTVACPLEVRLFGTFELRVDGEVREKVPAAVQALLSLIIYHSSTPLSRQELATTLWPNVSHDQASFYFRRALSQLRALLGEAATRIGNDLSIDLSSCECDLASFRGEVLENPASAVAFYSGPLVVGQRNHRLESIGREIREQYLSALWTMSEQFEADKDYPAAIRALRLLVKEDRSIERAWRSLICLLGTQHDHVGAARAFRQLRLALREELGIEPEPETTAAYHRVMAESDLLRVRPTSVETSPLKSPRLPTPLNQIIGRGRDLDAIRDALQDRRLVFIVGLGGVGKSRLAIELAETCPPSASVSLARVRSSEELRSSLTMEQLFPEASSSSSSRLLLLDNAEHLLEPLQEAVEELLTDHPELTILVTSRKSVTWPDAYVYRLPPLEVSVDGELSVAELSTVSSVSLFIDRARAANPEFSLTSRNALNVASICRKLDGLPLAIELAAAKARSMPIAEIDRRLSDRFALLKKQGSTKTLETVLDWSYEGLSDSERNLFLDLVQLPGLWSYEAMAAICIDLADEDIDSLVALDLVTFSDGRYGCLQTVREYGLRKRRTSQDLVSRFAQFFFREVESRLPALLDKFDPETSEWFFREEPNLSWILQRATDSTDPDFVRQALVLYSQLFNFWMRTGRASVGYRLGLCLLDGLDEPSEELTAALISAGGVAHKVASIEIADSFFARAESMAKRLGLASWRAESLLRRAELLSDRSQFTEATGLLTEALSEFNLLENREKQAICLRNLGYVERELGHYPEAIEYTRRALRIHTECNDIGGKFWCIGGLGAIYMLLGDPLKATHHFRENIEAAREIGDIYVGIWNLVSLAEAQNQLSQFEDAEQSVRTAIAMHGPDADEVALEWPVSLLGEILTEQGKYEAADQALNRAWQIHGLAGKSKLGVYTILRRAELHRRWGRFVSASTYFEIAERLVSEFEVEHLSERVELLRAKLSTNAQD